MAASVAKKRRYNAEYINYGFTPILADGIEKPQSKKKKKAHTIGETLIKPCALKMVKRVLGEASERKIQQISLSDDTVKRRISEMSDDIMEQVKQEIKSSPTEPLLEAWIQSTKPSSFTPKCDGFPRVCTQCVLQHSVCPAASSVPCSTQCVLQHPVCPAAPSVSCSVQCALQHPVCPAAPIVSCSTQCVLQHQPTEGHNPAYK
ncbi:uncharacterized protein LOC121864027 [Homarus americanus]|uniref:uncharacterized protein LOC121864027 n=1 Tax=Homarus americanus TaxID=6706 RepID=UPI001C48AA92|nr:uncharacterized protein LOC121864027 [Homarus americanus]